MAKKLIKATDDVNMSIIIHKIIKVQYLVNLCTYVAHYVIFF